MGALIGLVGVRLDLVNERNWILLGRCAAQSLIDTNE